MYVVWASQQAENVILFQGFGTVLSEANFVFVNYMDSSLLPDITGY